MVLLNEATALYVGAVPAKKAYLGDTLVWEPPSAGWGPDEFIFAAATTPAGTSPQSFPFTFGIRFTPVVDGRITGVRFYSYAAVTGRPVSIWSDAGVRLAHGVGGAEAGIGWQVIPLDEPLSVKAGEPLVTSYGWHNSWGQFGYTVEQTPVSASPNLVAGKGSYHQGDMDTFPEADGGQHYYADVVFQAGSDGLDPDTQRFLDATGLPEYYAPALDWLVKGLKGTGLWVKMNAVYPFIGGTADFHKWNLIDPRDTDDAFRLTFTGGAHSDEQGYRANPQGMQVGSPNHADTHLVPLGLMDQNSTHLAFYSLEDTPPGDRAEMGCFNWTGSSASRFHIIARYVGPSAFYYGMSEEGANSNVGVPSADGLFVATRTGPTAQAGYHKGAVVQTSAAPSIALPHVPIWLGAINVFANKSDIPCGFASVGSGLDAQNVADLNTVVSEYRLAVSHAHWTPASIPGLVTWIDPAQDTFGDGQKIATYREHSDNGYSFNADSRPEYQPIFRAGAHPHIEFSGQHFGLVGPDINLGAAGLTFVTVDTHTAVAGIYPMTLVHGPDADGFELRHDGTSTQIVERYTTYGIAYSHTVPDPINVKTLHILRVTPGVRTDAWIGTALHQDGRAAAMPNVPWTQYVGRRQGGYYYLGYISEALVFAGPVSDADLALLTDYLATKHNLYAL